LQRYAGTEFHRFRAIYRVAPVMSRPILHIRDQTLAVAPVRGDSGNNARSRGSEFRRWSTIAQRVRQIDVATLALTAEIVHITSRATLENQFDVAAVIAYVQPIRSCLRSPYIGMGLPARS